MRVRPLHHLLELRDDMRRGSSIGIPHTHVDDVLTAPTRGKFQLSGDVEDIRRQAIDARKAPLACGIIGH